MQDAAAAVGALLCPPPDLHVNERCLRPPPTPRRCPTGFPLDGEARSPWCARAARPAARARAVGRASTSRGEPSAPQTSPRDARHHAAHGDAHRTAAAARACGRHAATAAAEGPAQAAAQRPPTAPAPIDSARGTESRNLQRTANAAATAEPATKASPRRRANAAPPPVRRGATVAAPEAPAIPAKTLPPRVDLAYKVFFGTHGFLIGDAIYRFEHADNRYRSPRSAKRAASPRCSLRGQGKVESRGLITDDGPAAARFASSAAAPTRRDRASSTGKPASSTLHDDKTAPLELPTFDPLTLMWQSYFTPPTAETPQRSAVATHAPRRRATRSRARRTETIEWPQGAIDTERWHRRARTARPTPTSGSRRRCATSRSRCA